MLDFSSSLYLGLRHASRSLAPWQSLTEGKPAALDEPPGAHEVARALARLIGGEQAILVPSTLHLFWDLLGIKAYDGINMYVDAGAYPIARWGIERAAARGTGVRFFAHHDPDALRSLLAQKARPGRGSLVVTDGFCPACGRSVPLPEYLDAVRDFGGSLLVDDTQALGVLGHSPGSNAPYGFGGGGTLKRFGITGPDILIGASLAKAFGAPVAVLAGAATEIERFTALAETRVHCSPPSAAVIHAADQALRVNEVRGDDLRARLAALVGRFRARLSDAGIDTVKGTFPVQRVAVPAGIDTLALHDRLIRLGVRAVPVNGRFVHDPGLSFLINARQHPKVMDRAADALMIALRRPGFRARGVVRI
jgi:8-amino-7-oxononanoate synthase